MQNEKQNKTSPGILEGNGHSEEAGRTVKYRQSVRTIPEKHRVSSCAIITSVNMTRGILKSLRKILLSSRTNLEWITDLNVKPIK